MENYLIKDNILYINDGIEIILTESFAERLDFNTLVLPSSLKQIGGAAFAACENLKEVKFKDQKNLELIDDGAFTLCHNLCHFDFADSIKTIGEMAFWECALEEVNLTENVDKIDDSAFWNNNELREINILNPDCKIGMDVLGECQKLKKGYIACGYPSLNDYNQADELIYTLLWLSCPRLHKEETSKRAIEFIKKQETLIMEKILENNNTAAMNGLVTEKLLSDELIERYIKEATNRDLLEISNLLLELKRNKNKEMDFGEFEL